MATVLGLKELHRMCSIFSLKATNSWKERGRAEGGREEGNDVVLSGCLSYVYYSNSHLPKITYQTQHNNIQTHRTIHNKSHCWCNRPLLFKLSNEYDSACTITTAFCTIK